MLLSVLVLTEEMGRLFWVVVFGVGGTALAAEVAWGGCGDKQSVLAEAAVDVASAGRALLTGSTVAAEVAASEAASMICMSLNV